MRLFSAFCATLLFSGLALSQAQAPGYDGAYGYGPYVPLVTTPEISLQTAAPAAVGARNATYGLEAGARNSTFETITNDGSSNYTEPVWYSGGGAPVISPEVSLDPRPMRAHHEMHFMMREHEGERAEAGSARMDLLRRLRDGDSGGYFRRQSLPGMPLAPLRMTTSTRQTRTPET